MRIDKKFVTGDRNEYCSVPIDFLEKLNRQNKLQHEDSLLSTFFDKGIIAITKEIQKITLHPTAKLFKEHLESYVEKHSRGYIKDIEKHHWDSHFYSEYMIIDIWLALFKVFSEVLKIKANAVDNSDLLTINTIIMKAMSREDREVCIKSSIVVFALAVCSIVLNPQKDIADIHDDLKNNEGLKDYNDTVKGET
ncbi:16335_t:CDS:2 [Funneliformis caledonium]|uniref:16335_t:CDS:1 n=1 Tax=Funneliformis caledonium TaxID=1117310 RepID=A0A9N9E893_9GLOM|nr:16335_t:CDS:2 [Funneliformis caledonium]